MAERDVRQIIVAALEEAGAFTFRDMGISDAFIEGTADASIDELAMDSLSDMELCIAIELNTGVEILPEQIHRIGTLSGIVAVVCQYQRLVESYEGLIARCISINQVNSVNIGLEMSMTPSEVMHLWRTFAANPSYWETRAPSNRALHPEKLRTLVVEWIEKLKVMHDLSDKPEVEPFERADVVPPSLTFYGDGGDPEGKTLLVCFTGMGHLVMMPVPSFLQALKASQVDVAIVRDIPWQGYRLGLKGVIDDPYEIGRALRSMLNFKKYRSVAVLGISGGCVSALIAALSEGADALMTVGIGHPDSDKWIRSDGLPVGEVVRGLVTKMKPMPVSLVYGAEMPRDEEATLAFAEIVPAKVLKTTSPIEPVGHNVLYPVLRLGKLSEFLNENLHLW